MEFTKIRFQFFVFVGLLTIGCIVQFIAAHHVVGGNRLQNKLIDQSHGKRDKERLCRFGCRRDAQSLYSYQLRVRNK